MSNHAYWRSTNGALGSKNSFAPLHLLHQYTSKARLKGENTIEWPNTNIIETHRFAECLRPYILIRDSYGQELNSNDTWKLFRKAIHGLIKERKVAGKGIAAESIIQRTDALAINFYAQPTQKFTLVTSLSIPLPPRGSFRCEKATFTLRSERSARFPIPSNATGMHSTHREISEHIQKSKYQVIRVYCEGKSIHDAFENGYSSLNYLRGLLNWYLTYGRWSLRFSSGSERPIPFGVVHVGPVHTLHPRSGGQLEEQRYWYEPTYSGDYQLADISTEDWAGFHIWRKKNREKDTSDPVPR